MRWVGLAVFLLLLAGCPNTERSGFPSTPDPDDDDTPADDDDDAADDDDLGDDDDVVGSDPCGEFVVTADAPPLLDHGGDVGTIDWVFTASCSTYGELSELFGGWVDSSGNGLDVSASLLSTGGTMADAVGQALRVEELDSFVAELDFGTTRFLPPPDLGSVYISSFEEGVSWQACYFGHGEVWTEEGGEATANVPDPLQFLCEE